MRQHINTHIDQFVTLVSENCPGGLDFVKKRAVCRAAAEFCRKTWAWREVLDDVWLMPDDSFLDTGQLARMISREALVYDVEDVRKADDNAVIRKTSRQILDKNHPDWRSETTDTHPTHFLLTPQRQLVFYPQLAEGAKMVAINLELVLVPTMAMIRFPDFLYNFYGETIAAGAVQRLQSQKGSEWFNPDQAKYFLAVFREALNEARVAQAKRVDALNARRRRSFR